MAMESNPVFDGESALPPVGGDSELPREARRRHRRGRRHERVKTYVPLEPLTIWMRSDPDRLQPQHYTQVVHQQEVSPATSKHEPVPKTIEPKAPKHEPVAIAELLKPLPSHDARLEEPVPSPELPKPQPTKPIERDPTQDMPALQPLPELDIRPRHFYTEPEVRQPYTTETEHDILPSTPLDGTHAFMPEVTEERPPNKAVAAPETLNASGQMQHTGEQLQELVEQTTQRAAELRQKRQESDSQQPTAELMHTVNEGQFETDTRMGHEELLTVAGSIRVDGVSIAEMFRADRLDEAGLRRVIAAFLRGERFEPLLADEILRQQMRFERDPHLRQVPLLASEATTQRIQASAQTQPRRTFNVRRQADRIADSLAESIDRAVEAAENNPNIAKTVGGTLAVIIYFVVLILIIKS